MVTAIRLLKNGRYGLFSDDRFLLSLSSGALLDAGVVRGDTLEDDELAELCARAKADKARNKALRLLAGRDHAKAELTRKIARTEGAEAAEAAADEMERTGLIDDRAFAERFANELYGRRLYGRRRAVLELCRRGVARTLAEEVCTALDDEPLRRATAFLEKKYPRASADEKEQRRALAALDRAGYDWDTAREALQWDTTA
ncbi:regulatory protein RecX [Ethanoligenens sp.]|uniref:regulatory protein RecX n=1 Tax=Ethanoligenens sp. TaxID=2099655 RepID=UPI0039EB9D97